MKLHFNQLWLRDLDETINSLPELMQLNNKSIFITGASGLVCSAVVELLLRYNETSAGNVRIFAGGRSENSMRDRFGILLDRGDLFFEQYDATKTNELRLDCDYVIHGASNAIPSLVMKEPVETMICNFWGLKELLDFVKITKVQRLVYISSSEVYGKKEDERAYNEDDYGVVDLLNPRNSYSESKRAAETLCSSYIAEHGIDAVIVRPGHIFGPTALKRDIRVSSSWAYDVAMGKDIVMKSDGAQIRSYCYCLDCAAAILKVLLHGMKSEAYNISNPNSILSIKELAGLLCEAGHVNLRIDKPNDFEIARFNPMNNSSLNSDKLQKLGWSGLFDGNKGIKHTVQILKDIVAKESI